MRSLAIGLLVGCAAWAGVPSGAAVAAIIIVPDHQPSIAAALLAAGPGDEVLVRPGVYRESGLVVPAGVHLGGLLADPAEVVTIDAGGADRVLSIAGGDTRLERLRLTGGAADRGGGLLVQGGVPRLEDLTIDGCAADLGGGVFVLAGRPLFARCLIAGNAAGTAGGGLHAVGEATVELIDCLLADNTAGAYGGAWSVVRASLRLEGCTVAGNRAPLGAEGAGFDRGDQGVVVTRTLVADNRSPAGFAGLLHALVADFDSRPRHERSLRWDPGWLGYLEEQLDDPRAGNLAAEPLFCRLPGDPRRYYGVAVDSPALPANNEHGVLIGAVGAACESVTLPPAHVLDFALHPPYPNPFNPATNIRYEIESGGRVHLAVYRLDGKRVATLVADDRAPGTYTATWSGLDDAGRRLASGVYVCRLRAAGKSAAVRLTLLK